MRCCRLQASRICRHFYSLKVLSQVIVIPLPHDDGWRVVAGGAMDVAAGADSLPVDDHVLSDRLFPFPKSVKVAGDPGGGVADDEGASRPHAAGLSGKRFRDDGT